MAKLLVWLDDERPMKDGYNVHVKTAQEAIELIKTGLVERISLDHDLGADVNGTGYDVAKFIEEGAYLYSQNDSNGIPPIKVSLHSQNPVGRKQMAEACQNAYKYWYNNENVNI